MCHNWKRWIGIFPVTVEQVVLMGCTQQQPALALAYARRQATHARVIGALGLAGLHNRHIRDLSGGQQQRVFLARALISEPDLLVLDEPTAGVDIRTAESVLHLLAHLNQNGKTILMTTHDLNAAAAHVPWVICLNQTIIAQGAPEEVFTVPTLNQTYHGDMLVIRQDGLLIIQEKPTQPHPPPGVAQPRARAFAVSRVIGDW